MTLDEWCSEIIEITATRPICHLSWEQVRCLRKEHDPECPLQCNAGRKIVLAISQEVFTRATRKETFGDESRLKHEILYGTVDERFPAASETFKAVIRSFLTFRCEQSDIANLEPTTLLQHSLFKVNEHLKEELLPAGCGTAPAVIFERRQRDLLRNFSHELDIEDYFRANPLLV